jgi:hypothetical protein
MLFAITIAKTVVIAVIEDYWESHLKNGSKQDLKLHGLRLSLSFSDSLSLSSHTILSKSPFKNELNHHSLYKGNVNVVKLQLHVLQIS